MDASRIRILALALLVAAPAAAFTLTLPSSGIQAGSTATLATDATGGNYTLYAPTQTGDCRLPLAAGTVPANGAITALAFDRAGPWVLGIDDGLVAQEQVFTVQPRPLQIYATPQSRAGLADYVLQVRDGSEAVPYAYVDLYLDDDFIRHARSDAAGRLGVPHEALPFAGTYTAAAYRDLDDNNEAVPGTQVTDYAQAFAFEGAPVCGALPAYDAPEQYGVGPSGTSLTRLRETLDLHIVQGDYQVVHVYGVTNITVTALDGSHPAPTAVTLMAGGVAHDPASLGIAISTGPGYVHLEGTWDVEADVTVHLDFDANQDGLAEAAGDVVVPVERDQPVRFVPVGSNNLTYMVPNRTSDGRPGVHVVRFRLVDQNGAAGQPPVVAEAGVRLEGDLLGSSTVAYNAGGGYWEAFATPTASDAAYAIVATWPGKATVRAVVDTPPDGGAKATPTSPVTPLRAGVEQDIKILVQRYNRQADESGLCSPTPACAYEVVTDAVVELFWADTGLPVVNSAGVPYRYDPGGPGTSCGCFELGGTYYFLAVMPERSGPMAAFATVSAGSAQPRHAYAPLSVLPRPAYNPVATPNVILAGEQTSIQLTAPGLGASTRSNYAIRILNGTGIDVAASGSYQPIGTALYWTAALPRGEYKLWVDERLDVERGLFGRNGTATPATISSRAADVRFAYADVAFRPERSEFGDLRGPRKDTYVLGNGFGAIQHLTITALRPDGTPANGLLTLSAHDDGVAFGLLALAGSQDPARFGGPQLFPPGQPFFISQEGQSYYLVESSQARTFTGELVARYTSSPLHVLAWGTGLGNAAATFRSTTSNLNFAQDANGSIHFIAPQAEILNITTRHGQAETPALALGEDNLVLLRVRDPTGVNALEGLEVGLTRQIFGPSQRPSGILHYPTGATYGVVAIGIRPDATGTLNAVAVSGPATAPVQTVGAVCYPDINGATACDRPAVATTPLSLQVLHATQVPYDPVAAGSSVLLDLPESITEGQGVDIRARTTNEPFPTGTVTAFGTTYPLFNGARRVAAPAVNGSTDFPITVRVDGYPSITRILTVLDGTPQAAPLPPAPASTGNSSTTPPTASNTGTGAPASTSSTSSSSPASASSTSSSTTTNASMQLEQSGESHRVGGLKKLLANPTILTLAVLVVGGAVAFVVRLVMRVAQRRAASMRTYDEPEDAPSTSDDGFAEPVQPMTHNVGAQPAPEPPSVPAHEAESLPEPARTPAPGPSPPTVASDFEKAVGDP